MAMPRCRLSSDPCAPLLFLFHGRGGNADSMSALHDIVPDEFSIMAPEGNYDFDAAGGKCWWIFESMDYDTKLEIAANVIAFMHEACRDYGLSPACMLGAGYSQGAGLLSLIGSLPGCPLHGIAFLSGLQVTGGFPSDMGRKRPLLPGPRIFMAHGTHDEVLPIAPMREWAAALRNEGFVVTWVEEEAGHELCAKGREALRHWLADMI